MARAALAKRPAPRKRSAPAKKAKPKSGAGAGDDLAEYRRKRDFGRTAEPAGDVAGAHGNSFVVQKHAATRLHYDFRLELDGVLKSWAVTRGPSLAPAERRLAVRTEDHPLAYGGFEGTIPKSEYGGGTVMLWDRGTWEPVDDPHEGLSEGKLKFRLDGERLNGGFMLVRMPPRGRETRENWLLIKERDEFADDADPLLTANVTSIATGRSMEEIAGGDSAVWHSDKPGRGGAEAAARSRRDKAKSLSLPEFVSPQLATTVDAPPAGAEWLHEIKYDGYRLLIAANGSDVRAFTRNALDWTEKFQPIVAAIRTLDLAGTLIDGEVVSFASDGRTDFSALQKALKEKGRLDFFAFDILRESGEDLTRLPLIERKTRLQELLSGLPEASPLHYGDHIAGNGERVLAHICAAGHEGIISKKASDRYRGGRSRSWLKVKCTRRQEFVIGGWTRSEKRRGFKSILVGAWKDGKLVYRGRVGTGFSDEVLEDLSARFAKLQRNASPFAAVPRELRRSRWVEPELVGEVAFAEFTSDGILRHPAFLGLREDKSPREVEMDKALPVTKVAKAAKALGAALAGGEMERSGIRISNPDKVVFPGEGLTKADLVAYYEAVAGKMLPHLAGRPLSLVRCPQGQGSKCFYQKHDSGGFPAELKRIAITEGSGETEEYLYIDDLPGIVAGVQMSTLEFHIWGSRADQLEKPDRIVFDLDPDEGLDFEDVRRAAFDLRDRLEAIGLTTFPMLSGGKGFHLVAPLQRRAIWPDVKAFCHGFAVQLGEDAPERYVANMAKAKRKGRIFIDYLRNERGSTAIAPYSTRARDGAPVAAPITWAEAETVSAANVFTVKTMPARALAADDPWAGYPDTKQAVTRTMLKAVKAK